MNNWLFSFSSPENCLHNINKLFWGTAMKKVNLALLTVLENDSLSCLVWGMWAKSPRIKSYVSTQREFRHCMHSAFLTQIIRRNSRQRWEQPPRAVFCRIGKAATDPCIGKASLFVLLPLPTQSQDLWETHSSSDSSNIFPSFFLACICSSNKTGIAFTHPPIMALFTPWWQWEKPGNGLQGFVRQIPLFPRLRCLKASLVA